MGGDRIAFLMLRPFHRAILEPVHASLRPDFPSLLTDDHDAVVRFKPRIVVAADRLPEDVTRALPSALVVWTRHGFSHKRYVDRCIKTCDIACVSSEWVRDDFERRGWRPRIGWWVTGFPPMDVALDRPNGLQDESSVSLGPGSTLLYAPTWNPSLNSAEVLGPNWLEELASRFPTLNVIIKPHPVIREQHPEWIQMWEIAAGRHGRAHVVGTDRNVYEFMPDADVLLTDASSVFFYWLAFDRPAVLVNNPKRFLDIEWFDLEGPEWTWRDAGIEIETPDELPDAIARCLQDPTEKGALRAVYRRRVYGDVVEAGASEKIAAGIRVLLCPPRAERAAVKRTWRAVRWRARREAVRASVRRTRQRMRRSAARLRRASRRLHPSGRAETHG